jgi:general secretion pathway protein N
MVGEQMMKRCACVIAVLASFPLQGALAQAPGGGNLQANDTDQAIVELHPAAAKNAAPRQLPPGGNPLWGIPMSSLAATRERPIFSASRRLPAPPAPMPVVEAPTTPPAAPEQPPFTLVGTAIGKPQNVALILDQTTKKLTRLHAGEAASGWYLRSVDLRAMILEKNSQTVTLVLPAPGSAAQPPNPPSASLDQVQRDPEIIPQPQQWATAKRAVMP